MSNLYKSTLASAGTAPTGDAVAADVLAGKTFSNASATGVTGTMTNNGAVSAVAPYTIPEGYHNGEGVVTAPAVTFSAPVTSSADTVTTTETLENSFTGIKGFVYHVSGNIYTSTYSNSEFNIYVNGTKTETLKYADLTAVNNMIVRQYTEASDVQIKAKAQTGSGSFKGVAVTF